MIIQKITLNNIRSYRQHPPIKLSTGVTLFEGDIGSGKSTILSAIEFALFGLGDITGTYLLRHGAQTGSVLLEFSVNSKSYKVFRSLKRKKNSVFQKDGYIVEDGQRTDYSVSEMKTRILEILNFNERPRPKTSSLIYRYAIFTPQEEMKEVLYQPVERRLETLRRAFRVEDYCTIAENASIVLNWIDREAEIIKRQTEDINEKRTSLQEENNKTNKFKTELEAHQNLLDTLETNRKEMEEKIEKLQNQKDEILKLQVKIPLIEKALNQKAKIILETLERVNDLRAELKYIEKAEQLLSIISPQYEELISCKEKAEDLEPYIEKIRELNDKKTKLLISIQNEKKNLKQRIQSIYFDLEKMIDWLKKNKPETLDIPSLENEESDLIKKVEDLYFISDRLVVLKQEKSVINQEIKNKNELRKQLKTEQDDLKTIGLGAPCPKCKQELTKKHYEKVQRDYICKIEELDDKISELKEREDELGKQIDDFSKQKKVLEGMNKKLGKIQQKLVGLRKQKEIVKEKEREYEQNQHLANELEKLIANEMYGETERKRLSEVNVLLNELIPIQSEYEEIKKIIKKFEKEEIEKKFHKNQEKISKKEKVTSDISENQGKITSLKEQLKKEKQEFREKQKDYESKKGVLEVIKNFEIQKKELDSKIDQMRMIIISKNKDIQRSREDAKRISDEIDARKQQLLKYDELKQYEVWVSDYFVPAIKLIESHMLANINSEFNSLFQKWIVHLLEAGDIFVSVDDNFSPHIVQSGYDIDVKSLSGGEKTSVALAYRLALNVMVKKVCDAMQSNLLILDEPTDGFSREQLSRLRDILNDLKCEQVIIVSHENELEGFVDNIFRIVKESGESQIVTA